MKYNQTITGNDFWNIKMELMQRLKACLPQMVEKREMTEDEMNSYLSSGNQEIIMENN